MANEKTDNCEVSARSPLGGYGMTENTGSGILSGSISHPGRGPEGEMREKKGFFEKPKENGILANIIKMLRFNS